ncbi:acyl transferase/acyl hydrolase/lysophospholipase [Pyronema domesticum]|nr:acyl transferase/acyl hydrolase/lysophospholipase [Pyronema domesticum]
MILCLASRKGNLPELPRPYKYFDLIGGASTGGRTSGLIAIMLGRLRMSTSEAIDVYMKLSEFVFGEKKFFLQDGYFKTRKFVCAIAAANSSCALFRSYHMSELDVDHDVMVWEAARATTAAPTFFKAINIGRPGSEVRYVDGTMGHNNPVKIRIITLDIIDALARVATSADRVAEEMEHEYRNRPGVYFRLNVDQGLLGITLDEFKKLAEVQVHTKQYLESVRVDQLMEQLVDVLVGTTAPAESRVLSEVYCGIF